MTLDYITKVEVNIDMQNYVKNVIDGFLIKIEISQEVASLATKNIFNMEGSNTLSIIKRVFFHTKVAIGFFL